MSMALRALEFCLHCLDISPWPFLLEEVLENYALAVEVQLFFCCKSFLEELFHSFVCLLS